jgi:predicted lipoprotein with Yx(FWY)xxD motif
MTVGEPAAIAGARHRGVLSILAVSCVLLVGCAQSSDAVKSYTVVSTDISGPGHVLADGAGYTLYIFTPDMRGPSKCYSVCAKDWPPLLLPSGVGHLVAGRGIDDALLGTTKRKNGSLQVTYNGWPLYRYYSDGPGQATGQAEDMGTWYLLSTSGEIDRQPITGYPNS